MKFLTAILGLGIGGGGGATRAQTPENMCAALGGQIDVDGKLVGSVVTGGRIYRCFNPNDSSFLAIRIIG
jgi:hypothetical protein